MPSTDQTAPTIEFAMLKPSQLVPNKHNIRRDVGDVSTLTESIKALGIQEPLKVCPNGKPDRYIVLAGHRRLAAAKAAKVRELPCIIDHTATDPADQLAIMLAENVERADLTAVEEADAILALFDLGESQASIVGRTGMSVSRVRSRKKIAQLPDELKSKITEHAVTLADAEFIANHSAVDEDAADLEAALGTNQWGVTKQKVVSRIALRKSNAALRKKAYDTFDGFTIHDEDVVGNIWDARRDKLKEYSEAVGGGGQRATYGWPLTDAEMAAATEHRETTLVEIAKEWNGKLRVTVIVLAPRTDRDDDAAAPSPSGDSPAGGHAPVVDDGPDEPDAEYLAEQKAREDRELATTVRRQFIQGLIAEGDIAKATAAARTAADYFVEYNEIFLGAVGNFVPVDLADVDVEDAGPAISEWLTGQDKPGTYLMAWAWQCLGIYDNYMSYGHPATYYDDYTPLAGVVAYFALLADLGHVLSDSEIAYRDLIQAALDEASDDE